VIESPAKKSKAEMCCHCAIAALVRGGGAVRVPQMMREFGAQGALDQRFLKPPCHVDILRREQPVVDNWSRISSAPASGLGRRFLVCVGHWFAPHATSPHTEFLTPRILTFFEAWPDGTRWWDTACQLLECGGLIEVTLGGVFVNSYGFCPQALR
jgi:hypothetical protein